MGQKVDQKAKGQEPRAKRATVRKVWRSTRSTLRARPSRSSSRRPCTPPRTRLRRSRSSTSPLDAVVDVEAALKKGSPKVHAEFPDNIAYHYVHRFGDVDAAFRKADVVVKVKLLNQRVHPVSLEPRGIAAVLRRGQRSPHDLALHAGPPQPPEQPRRAPQRRTSRASGSSRPTSGGGFGGKAAPYPEDVVVAYAAKKLLRPIKWEESRREHMMTMTHGRGQNQWAELAVQQRRQDPRIQDQGPLRRWGLLRRDAPPASPS